MGQRTYLAPFAFMGLKVTSRNLGGGPTEVISGYNVLHSNQVREGARSRHYNLWLLARYQEMFQQCAVAAAAGHNGSTPRTSRTG